jgi:hypothetical protein
MNLISTKKSCEKWAKNKLEKLGKGYNKIHFGQTHASFIKEKKDGSFSAIQEKYPNSILSFVSNWGVLILTILIYSIVGAGIGMIIGSLFFEDKGIIILSIVGFVIAVAYQIWDEIRFS